MSSKREEIRAAVLAILEGISQVTTGSGDAAISRIYTNRAKKLWPNELPAILIYTRSEASEIGVAAPRAYKRIMKLAIEIVCKGAEESNFDDTIDTISEDVEQRIFRNETLNGLVSDILLSDTEMDYVMEGDQPIGAAVLTFNVEYWTDAPIEQPDLDDFTTVHSEITPQPQVEDTAPAIDDLTLEQE